MDRHLSFGISDDMIVYHLTRSKLLVPYLREVIVRETLEKWQQSPECPLILHSDNSTLSDVASSEQISGSLTNQVNERKEQLLLLERYKQLQWGHLLKTRFLERKSKLDRVLFSAIQVADFNLANELYCRIQEQGQSFTKLATIYSQNSSAKVGGALGPISIEKLHPLIYHHLIGLKPKQLSCIFELDENYLLETQRFETELFKRLSVSPTNNFSDFVSPSVSNFQYIFLRLDLWLPVQFNPQIQAQLLNELFTEWMDRQVAERIGLIKYSTFNQVTDLNTSDAWLESENKIPKLTEPEWTEPISPTSSFFFPTSDSLTSNYIDRERYKYLSKINYTRF